MNAIFRLPLSIHVFLYRRTGGRLGGRIQGLDVLLLTTKGHRTGKTRTAALGYFEHQGSYVIIASKGGSDRHPGWFHNLRNDPNAWIQIRERRLEVWADRRPESARCSLESAPGVGAGLRDLRQEDPAGDPHGELAPCGRLVPNLVVISHVHGGLESLK